jgi:MoaA/NifB/PqqE/SkfB family radical SAM enzyme
MAREQILRVIEQVKSLGTCTLGLTGGEPLLRDDLEEFVRAAAPEMTSIIFTTGHRLDRSRAASLAVAGVACVTIGLESADPMTHDRVRGSDRSFAEAEAAAVACREAGIYLAVSTMATREKLAGDELEQMYALATRWGAGEFRVLAPVATGGWLGRSETMLSPRERLVLVDFHRRHNRRDHGPAVASFAHLESDALFGCGAGFHHLFIDAAGHVCPCDLTPLSFGNANEESLIDIWHRMASYFPRPRRGCLMDQIAGGLNAASQTLPLPPSDSEAVCSACRPTGRLPGGYSRLMKPGQTFKNPEP